MAESDTADFICVDCPRKTDWRARVMSEEELESISNTVTYPICLTPIIQGVQEAQPLMIRVDKRLQRIRYENESEAFVTIVIEAKM